MTDKELRKLRRDDLLQILINQQKQIDELTDALAKAQASLEQRRIAISQSGSLAEAALRLNGVFESAQAAADQYLSEAHTKSEEMYAQGKAEIERARRVSEDVTTAARAEADRILREARAEADRLLVEAGGRPVQPPEPVVEEPKPEESKRRSLFGRNRKA